MSGKQENIPHYAVFVTGEVNKLKHTYMGNLTSSCNTEVCARFSEDERVLRYIDQVCVRTFLFQRNNVNREVYLAMLQNWLMELLFKGERANFIFQQDGAPPHRNLIVRQYLNATLHNRWIGHARNDNYMSLHWPP